MNNMCLVKVMKAQGGESYFPRAAPMSHPNHALAFRSPACMDSRGTKVPADQDAMNMSTSTKISQGSKQPKCGKGRRPRNHMMPAIMHRELLHKVDQGRILVRGVKQRSQVRCEGMWKRAKKMKKNEEETKAGD